MLFGSSSIVNTSRLVNFLARNTTSNLGTTASSARNHFLSPRHALLFSSTMASATSGSDPQYFTGASGCFWGPDALYRKHFTGKGLIDAQVGYIGGNPDINNPSYEDVCTGKTGHAEAIQVKFDPSQVSYAELVEFLYRTHDPTTKDRQGADRGTQYRSAIFPHNDEQLAIVKKVTEEVQAKVGLANCLLDSGKGDSNYDASFPATALYSKGQADCHIH